MSKRHNMVTRKDRKIEYDMLIMTVDGKQYRHGTAYGPYTPASLKALEAAKLKADKALLLDLTISSDEEHLFGMPREEYFRQAVILD